jgi:hypothetical protein
MQPWHMLRTLASSKTKMAAFKFYMAILGNDTQVSGDLREMASNSANISSLLSAALSDLLLTPL